MPYLTRVAIRVAMVYLLVGLAGWMIYTLDQIEDIGGNWSALRPVSTHLIAIGWLTQLIFAVMYWMFPIISRQQPQGTRWIAWLGFWGLNLGLIFRAVFEIGISQGMSSEAGWGLVGAAVLHWSGASAWIIATWERVRERGGR